MPEPSAAPHDALAELRAELGPGAVLTGDDAEPFLVDHRRVFHGRAEAVVRPMDHDGVAATVHWAVRHDRAVVTQGGNTSLSGGATPATDRPTILLSTRRLDRIVAADAVRGTLHVEAGVTVAAAQDAAVAVGRWFAPDWGARGSATVGGAVATNAGGLNVLRHGMMRHHVLGLRAVLADGRELDLRRHLTKDNTGPDLVQLLVGSEGTLAVVTEAVLRLGPAARAEASALLALPSLDALLPLYGELVATGDLTAIELVPEAGLRAVCERRGRSHPLPGAAEWYLLVRAEAGPHGDRGDALDRLGRLAADAADAGRLVDAAIAATDAQEAELWFLRDELSPTGLLPGHEHAVKLDVAVPTDRIPELLATAAGLADTVEGATVHAFGHVGDGNVHLYVLIGPEPPEDWPERRQELTERLHGAVVDVGGTLSAEHGVGRLLRQVVPRQKSAAELALQAGLRAVFDPDGRLNPGIGLPPPGEVDR